MPPRPPGGQDGGPAAARTTYPARLELKIPVPEAAAVPAPQPQQASLYVLLTDRAAGVSVSGNFRIRFGGMMGVGGLRHAGWAGR
jgi:hypothetical protein